MFEHTGEGPVHEVIRAAEGLLVASREPRRIGVIRRQRRSGGRGRWGLCVKGQCFVMGRDEGTDIRDGGAPLYHRVDPVMQGMVPNGFIGPARGVGHIFFDLRPGVLLHAAGVGG